MLTSTRLWRGDKTRSPDSYRESTARAALDLIQLRPLMALTSGDPEMIIGLVDGPLAIEHPDLTRESIRELPGRISGKCVRAGSMACMHGTFVAGVLCAKRNSPAPAICPNCTLLVRPIFSEAVTANALVPSATPRELAAAISECIKAGARVVNVSAALAQAPSAKGEHALGQALDYAANRGIMVVAASGNQGMIGSTAITRHPWVIAVTACDRYGRPLNESNLGNSIGRWGLSAPGEGITSLGTDGEAVLAEGTSVAAPFVTGTIALLWSEFPHISGGQLRSALHRAHAQRRPTVVPPLLNAWAVYQTIERLVRCD